MRNAKKTLSLVMIAIFTTFIVLSGIPAGAVTTAQAKAQVTKATAAVVKVEKTVKVANFNVTTAQTQLTAATKEVAKVKSLGKTYTKTYTALNLRNANVNKKIAARKLAIANAAKALAKLFTDADAAVAAAEKATDADEVDLVTDEAALANAQGAVTAALEFIVKLDKNSSNYKGLMARVDSANNLIVKAMDEKAAIEAEAAAAKAAEEAAKVAAEKEAAAKTAAETAVAAVEKAPLVTAADATAAKELSKTAATAVAAVKEADKATFTARLKVMDDKVVALEAALKAKADAELEAAKPATITATAANEAITVTFSKATAAPVAADFEVMMTVGTATATTVTGITVVSVSDTVATLKVPAVAPAAADQSVVFTVAYKGQTAVTAAAFTVAKLPTVVMESVTATKADTITVKLSKAVDTTKAVIDLKLGTVKVNVKTIAWDDAKTTATLTGFANFAAGTYSVAIAGVNIADADNNKSVVISAQKIASIAVTGDVAPLTATGALTATVGFKVLDQYGADVTTTLGAGLNISTSATSASIAAKVITITWTATPAIDAAVVVTLIDPATGTVGTKTLKVGKPAQATTIALSALANKDSKVLRTSSAVGTDFFDFTVTANDQYGNAVSTATTLGADFIVLTSDTALTTAFVSATTTAPAKLRITGIPAAAGTYTVTLVAKSNGASVVGTVVVDKAIGLDSFVMTAPTDAVVAGESVYVPFTALDQYGTAITSYAGLNGKPTFSLSDNTNYTLAFEKNAVDGTAKLKLSVTTGASITVSAVITSVFNGKVSTFTVKPLAAKIPTRISAISADTVKKLTVGGVVTLSALDFTILDQYERAMTLPTGWTLNVVTSDAAKVSVAGTTLTGVAAGPSTITVKLTNTTPTVLSNSAFEFVATTVAKADIVSYVIDVPDAIYAPAAIYTSATAEEAAYAASYSVYGKTSAGDSVALATGDVQSLSSTNSKVTFDTAEGLIYADGTSISATTKAESATLVAIINGANGIQTVTKSITLKTNAPVGGAIAAKATKGKYVTFADGIAVMTVANVNALNGCSLTSSAQYTSTTRAAVYFEILDQYEVASAAVKPAYYTLSVTDADGTASNETGYAGGTYSVVASTGIISAAGAQSGDTIVLTAVTGDGKVATVKIIVQ